MIYLYILYLSDVWTTKNLRYHAAIYGMIQAENREKQYKQYTSVGMRYNKPWWGVRGGHGMWNSIRRCGAVRQPVGEGLKNAG